MSLGNKIGWAVLWTLLVVVIVGGIWAIMDAQQRTADRDKFSGACIVLDGKVEGSVCISDGKVVLTREDFERESN